MDNYNRLREKARVEECEIKTREEPTFVPLWSSQCVIPADDLETHFRDACAICAHLTSRLIWFIGAIMRVEK